MSDQQQDTEIILGTGKLLGIFFGLVAICGTFFGLGYGIGRNTSGGPVTLQDGQTVTVAKGPVTKPAAGVTVTAAPAAITETPQTPIPDPNAAASAQVQQTPATQDSSVSSNTSSDNTATGAVQPGLTQVAAKSTTDPNGAAPTITVQVAAVTKEEDAQALVTALRRKNYPVFVPPNPSADNLYHVQVGPFAELKDAEAMKSKLAGDGYNAIVKK